MAILAYHFLFTVMSAKAQPEHSQTSQQNDREQSSD